MISFLVLVLGILCVGFCEGLMEAVGVILIVLALMPNMNKVNHKIRKLEKSVLQIKGWF